jgi:hypothetical protein
MLEGVSPLPETRASFIAPRLCNLLLPAAAAAARLKAVSASQGLMLEGVSPALSAPGGPHWACPDKEPAARLATIEAAGKARAPFTSGMHLLYNIGWKCVLAVLYACTMCSMCACVGVWVACFFSAVCPWWPPLGLP